MTISLTKIDFRRCVAGFDEAARRSLGIGRAYRRLPGRA
jgi:hypothetical protein